MAARKAGMDTGVEVARISVKVHPNTKDFRRELRRQLDDIEKSENADIGPDRRQSVKTTRNTVKAINKELDGLSVSPENITRQLANLRRSVAKDVDGINKELSRIDLAKRLRPTRPAKNESLEEITARFRKEAAAIRGKVSRNKEGILMPELMSLGLDKRAKNLRGKDDISRAIDEMNRKLAEGKPDLRFDNRVAKFRKQLIDDENAALEEQKRRVQDLMKGDSFKELNKQDLDQAQRNMYRLFEATQRANAELDKIPKKFKDYNWFTDKFLGVFGKQGRPIKVPLDFVDANGNPVNEKGRGKSLFGFLSKNKGEKNPAGFGLPKFGSGLNPTAWALILGAGLFAAAPVVGAITTALLAIPAIIGLIGGAIGAITLGLDGFKKAAESINEPFEKLREKMNVVNEEAFKPLFQAVADNIFPSLEKALPAVSQGLAEAAQGITDAFARPENIAMFEGSLQKLGAFFTQIRPGIDDFTSGLIQLIDEFTAVLPDLGDWFNNTGADFKAWISELSEGGGLQTAFRNLGSIITTILEMLGRLGIEGMNFFRDKNALQTFNAALKEIGDTLANITKFSASFNQMLNKMGAFGLAIRGFNDLLGGKLSGAKDIWSGVTSLFSGGGGDAAGGLMAAPTVAPMTESELAAARLEKALGNVDFAAQQAQANLSKVWGTESPAAVQGPGFNNDYPIAGQGGVEADAGAPTLPAPDTSEAIAKLQEYDNVAKETMQSAEEALRSASTDVKIKAPDFSGFNAGVVEGMRDAARKGMDAFVQGIDAGSDQARGAAIRAGLAAKSALESTASSFSTVGEAMMAGLAAGIDAGQSTVIAAAARAAAAAKKAAEDALGIESPSKEFMKIGEYSMQGLSVGLENGIEPVIAQAKGLAWQISEAFASGDDPTGFLNGMDKSQVSRVEKVLGFEAKRLELQAKALTYQSKVTGNEALKGQADAIRLKKEEIMLQKDMIGLTREFSELNGGGGNDWLGGAMGNFTDSLVGAPFDFANATTGQFMSDLGINGGGAISSLMDYGMQFGKSAMGSVFNFNVSNVDDAIALKNNQLNRDSIGVVGRG